MVDPKRIRRSRAKGWTLPDNAVIVDRTSRWGNPFVVSKDGTTAQCVRWYAMLLQGYLVMGKDNCDTQDAAFKVLRAEADKGWPTLKGKDLACWCALDKPCHADVLLHAANGWPLDLVDYMRSHGYKFTRTGHLEAA